VMAVIARAASSPSAYSAVCSATARSWPRSSVSSQSTLADASTDSARRWGPR
jgi:hypothetical protein